MRRIPVQTVQVFITAIACVLPSVASAQYNVQGSDTLWYTENTHVNIEMRPPGAPMTMTSTHEAEIGITFIAPGKARAWFAAFEIEQKVQDQVRSPDMSPALNRPYHLSFDARGRIATDSAPSFSEAMVNTADLAQQFADFFISLPSEELRPGVAWEDTLGYTDGDGESKTYVAERIRSFRVERDTTVAGARAFVIAVTEEMSVNASEIDNQGNTITMDMAGTESGTAVFSPALGRMLSRERTGQVSGEMKLVGGVMPITMSQKMDYSGTITLGRK